MVVIAQVALELKILFLFIAFFDLYGALYFILEFNLGLGFYFMLNFGVCLFLDFILRFILYITTLILISVVVSIFSF